MRHREFAVGRFGRVRADERGAVLAHVAIGILAFMAFTSFVFDHGLMWVSRRQAQNAADAGALAGALARAYDEPGTPTAGGRAYQSAYNVARQNAIWTEAPGTVVTWDCPPEWAGGRCVRVDVYRNGTNGSTPLPTFFGRLVGVTEQGVRATASAVVGVGNTTNCLRPWGVADLWEERTNSPNQYNHWRSQGNTLVEENPHDLYVPPSASGPGTGYRLPRDYGTELVLKSGNPNSSSDPVEPGWFLPLRLPDGNGGYMSGGDPYREAIASCIGSPVQIGDLLPTESGAMIGPTSQGFNALRATDPNAVWNPTTRTIDNSCAPGCAPFSPRIVPLPVFDMDDYQRRRVTNDFSHCPTGGRCVRVVNILGFFASHMQGSDVIGYLVRYPGLFTQGSPSLSEEASFLVFIQLVR